jgi:diacylglycerol kinase
MLLEAAVTEPLPIDATATAVLIASLAVTAVWLAYLYR